ncbi:MAG: AraC family transcriptional regulator [Pseudomonadales bacterium]
MPNIARAINALVLDTPLLAKGEAFEMWREFISRQIFKTSVFSRTPESFQGRMEVQAVQDNRIIFTRSASYGTERRAAEISQTQATGLMWLILCTRKPMRIIHRRHDEILNPGDVIVLHGLAPYFRFEAPVNMTVFACPHTTVAEWGDNLAASAGRAIRPTSFWANLLSTNLLALHPRQLDAARQQGQVVTLTDHITSMLVQAVCEMTPRALSRDEEGCRHSASQSHLRDQMVLWLEKHFDHSGVSARQLANAFGISQRYLHKTFSASGSHRSYLETLQGIRLRHATLLLRSYEKLAPGDVGDVALRCGFSDPGTFRRLFKKGTGRIPTRFLELEPAGMAASAITSDQDM